MRRTPANKPVRVLSLGAGWQSSALALMAAQGVIEPPEFAVFADTGAEPRAVYEYLAWLESVLPFEVMHVSAGFLSAAATTVYTSEKGGKYTKHAVPAFTANPDGTQGRHQRHCTFDFKVEVIRRAVRQRVGKGQHVDMLIGISTDEATRVKPSKISWITNVYPLLLELRMNRLDCSNFIERNGFPMPPRSSCIFCPCHSDAEWRHLKEFSPDEFMAAAAFERRYQAACAQSDSLDGVPYLHRSLSPLDEVNFTTAPGLFGELCEGACGV